MLIRGHPWPGIHDRLSISSLSSSAGELLEETRWGRKMLLIAHETYQSGLPYRGMLPQQGRSTGSDFLGWLRHEST